MYTMVVCDRGEENQMRGEIILLLVISLLCYAAVGAMYYLGGQLRLEPVLIGLFLQVLATVMLASERPIHVGPPLG